MKNPNTNKGSVFFLACGVRESSYVCEWLEKLFPDNSMSPNWCRLCKSESETQNHIFIRCRYTSLVWNKVWHDLSLMWMLPWQTWATSLIEICSTLLFDRSVLKGIEEFSKKKNLWTNFGL